MTEAQRDSGQAFTSSRSSSAPQQRWTAEGYDTHARFVSAMGAQILSWLDPRPGERILDLGCGDGALTEEIARSGAEVTGADISEDLLAVARARGLDARNLDGHALPFLDEFDAVFSNAALHWMPDQERVLAGVRRALRPGGRFVAEFGGHGNVAAIITAMRSAAMAYGGDPELAGPWFYPTPDEYSALLVKARFEVRRIELVPRPTPLATGMDGWLLTFRRPLFDQFAPVTRDQVLRHAIELLRPSLQDKSGRWTADYIRLRVLAAAV
jgi:SAM-dependent methyltransferase